MKLQIFDKTDGRVATRVPSVCSVNGPLLH